MSVAGWADDKAQMPMCSAAKVGVYIESIGFELFKEKLKGGIRWFPTNGSQF